MALSKLTVRRLTKLADYMASLPKNAEKHFRMSAYAQHEGAHDHDFPRVITKKELNLCGTSACALGWASTIRSFRRAGLELIHEEFGEFDLLLSGEPLEFGWHENNNISALFPGIEPKQAEYLFGGTVRVKTPKQWAARCRRFLERNANG